MTANGRPNLGGLFTGSTPPERSSTIADALDPLAGGSTTGRERQESPRPQVTSRRMTTPPPITTTVDATKDGDSGAWWDPVNALGYYFDFMQGLFDANRSLTMAVATAVTAPLRRSRSTR